MYFIVEASGSGKTAVLNEINIRGYTMLDFDNIGISEKTDIQRPGAL
jgi:predicted ATPase